MQKRKHLAGMPHRTTFNVMMIDKVAGRHISTILSLKIKIEDRNCLNMMKAEKLSCFLYVLLA